MTMLSEIQETLRQESNPEAKVSFQKFVPSSQGVYGVRVPILNELAKQYKSGGFDLAEKLWKSGAFEERLLAAKILGNVCKKDANRTLALVHQFSNDVSDWAVCDTLATQGIRAIAKIKQKEIFDLSKEYVNSEEMWQSRLGIVLLTNYAKDNALKEEIRRIIRPLKKDKEYYIKKAIDWINRDLGK